MATFSGEFPVLGSPCVALSVMTFAKNGAAWKGSVVPSGSTSFLYSEDINGLYNWNGSQSAMTSNWFGPLKVKVVGEPTPRPPDRFLLGRKVRRNNKPFKKKMHLGQMVVSDFRSVDANLSYINGGPSQVTATKEYGKSFVDVIGKGGFVRGHSSAVATKRSNVDGASGAFKKKYEVRTFSDSLTPYDVGWSDEVIQNFIDSINIPETIGTLVTKNTSEANGATVDILTSLAEMPESIRMCLNGMQRFGKLVVDMKKSKLQLLNKAKRIKTEHTEKVFRVNYESRQAYLAARNSRSRAILEKKRKTAVMQLNADLKRSLADVATATAQVELTVRYGILPVKYTIDGLIKSFEDIESKYVRWSSLEVVESDFPSIAGFTKTGTLTNEMRAFIKRQFSLAGTRIDVLKSLSASLIVTAYELIPLSFVFDWFIQVGDLLKALYGSNLSGYKQAATISSKVYGNCVYLHEETGCSVKVEVKGFMRYVINPSDYCRLSWEPDVGGYRTYDAVALSWLFLKDTILKHK